MSEEIFHPVCRFYSSEAIHKVQPIMKGKEWRKGETPGEVRVPGTVALASAALERGVATHSSILAWRIPWTEEPCELQSTGLQRVGYGWATDTHISSQMKLKNVDDPSQCMDPRCRDASQISISSVSMPACALSARHPAVFSTPQYSLRHRSYC